MTSKYIQIYDVKAFYATSQSDYAIQLHIDALSAADTCLDALGITQEQINLLKLYVIAHQLTIVEGGLVKSETDMDGASVSYAVKEGGTGFNSTSYGMTAQSMVGYECISAILDKPKRFAGAV